MNSLKEKVYDIKDLRIVMINKNYVTSNKDEYINYFNENIKFIVEKQVFKDSDTNGNLCYHEYYTECVTEEDLLVRSSDRDFDYFPNMFSIVSRIPSKYFTKEELQNGKISTIRIYKIFQDINFCKEDVKGKVKNLKKS
ncbi:MAG: hypothetical protein IKN63_04330 [Bacilli bacterium]|nr:hypothetical protein [Bacilli bacterium]